MQSDGDTNDNVELRSQISSKSTWNDENQFNKSSKSFTCERKIRNCVSSFLTRHLKY